MLLHHGQQLERHAAGPLGAGLPLLHGGLAGVEVAGKDGLAYVVVLAQLFDLLGLDVGGHGQAALVKTAHGGFVDGTDFEQRAGRGVDGLEGIGFEFGFGLGCHGLCFAVRLI
jgi:hypothetical protein